jgi:hypothetical protein
VDIAIVKGERRHRGIATTSQRSVQFAVADYGTALPHELVHLVVERSLGLTHGFWGLLAAGADLATVQLHGARRPRTIDIETDPLVTEHREELLTAERLVAQLYRFGAGEEPDHGVEPEAAAQIRAEIVTLNERWQQLPVGGALRSTWP